MTRDAIIKDLIRRRPVGPGRQKITYTVEESYCYDARRYKRTPVPSVDQYGYTNEELFDLQFKELADVASYFRARDFEGKEDWRLGRKKATLTRRTNLLWSRISSAVRSVERDGAEGIYRIQRGYGRDPVGHVYARTKEEATENATLFYGYLYPEECLRTHFVRRGSVDEIYELNAQTTKKIESFISRCKNEIEAQANRMTSLEALLVTLKMVESQQVAVETVQALNVS